MVTFCRKFRIVQALLIATFLCLLAAERRKYPFEKLDPPSRAKVLMALTGLVILGFGMIALVYLGARFTRRYMNSSSKSDKPSLSVTTRDAWADKPLNPEEDDS